MKKKSLTTNYLYNSAYKILTLLTPLITTPYVSRILGVDNIGIYNYTYSVVSYFVLFGVLGLQMYGQREIACHFNNPKQNDKVFWQIVWVRMITIGIALTAYVVILWNTPYRVYYVIFGLELLANAFDISWYYYGKEEFKQITIRNFIVKLIGVACVFLFINGKEDLPVYIFCHVIVLFFGNMSLWFGMKSRIELVYPISKECFKHVKMMFIFFVPQCIDSVYMLMDKVMLGNISTMQQVGIYGQADKIVKMLVTVISSMGLVVSPRIAQCFSIGDYQGIKKYMRQSFGFVFSIGLPIVFGLISIAPEFSTWFFGTDYDGVDMVMGMLAPIIILMGLNSVMGWQYLMTVGKEKDFIKSVSVGAMINFIMNYILIPRHAALGAVVASIASMLVMTLINVYFVKNVVSVKEIILMLLKPLSASLLMFCTVKLVGSFLHGGFIRICIEAVVGVTIYLILALILKDEFIKRFIDKCHGVLKVKKR